MVAAYSAKVVATRGGGTQSSASAVPSRDTPKSTTISFAKFAATLVFLSQYGSDPALKRGRNVYEWRNIVTKIWTDSDLTDFWNEDDYYAESYTDNPLTKDKIDLAERALGFKLPASYIELMSNRNGGAPIKTNHRTKSSTSWAEDHVAMTGFLSVGDSKDYSLCGGFGSQFHIDEWGYPPIGVYFADCPSAGHDLLCLDYSSCGPSGEPRVVHVDQENDYKITHVADTFEQFVRGLESDEAFDGE